MAEKRESWDAESDEQSEDVEGHKLAPEDEKFDKFAESSDDDDDEVEAHKF
jgi:hypothetical protein